MTNISSLEIAELRPFFQKALQHLQVIQGETSSDAGEHPGASGGALGEDEVAVRGASSTQL
jgi:hypothetical protein